MWQSFKNWYAQPFDAEMNATGWFLLIGLIIVILSLWGFILYHLRQATA